ncbi:hypothetical protein TNCV_2348791 [Trichonephila clavipes]|uniref:Uncharacterized protein n=1 Tax=Trichonephila clavipes TaxID=2585209 RepID=A0A8X6VKI9_TRICX|nr:hypothetical protein TNCV_2348791 [Trichonephila clavipes]
MAVMDHVATSRTITQPILSVTHHLVPSSTIRFALQQSGMSAKRSLLHLPLIGIINLYATYGSMTVVMDNGMKHYVY